jgi:hypothetical protein
MLLINKKLRKLELEGNQLGSKTAKELGLALLVNTTLKVLDLESNLLSPHEQSDSSGILKFIEGVKANTTLISLNIANNQLGPELGVQFRNCLEKNHTLIDFEFGNNSFRLEDVRKIQEYLKRNRELYNKARLEEWNERTTMRTEMDDLEKLYLKESTQEEQDQMEEDEKMIEEKKLDEKWAKYVAEMKIEKEQMISMLTDSAALRGKKRKKGKGGKGPKSNKKKGKK